jgi:hypothetical protein
MNYTTTSNIQKPNQFKEITIELDGTLKRGGTPIPELNIKNVFEANDREFRQPHGQRFHRTAIANINYTLSTADYLVGVTSLVIAPSIGLPLPSLVGAGKHFKIKDEVGGAATTTITIRSDGERLIDGATSLTITTNYGARSIYTNGTDYFTH